MTEIYVLCNAQLLMLPALIPGGGRKLSLLQASKPVDRFGELVFAARLYLEELEAFTEEEYEQAGAWWREIGASNASWDEHPWQPRVARKYQGGIFGWICDRVGASTEKNVAAVLGDICGFEQKTPIELFNSL